MRSRYLLFLVLPLLALLLPVFFRPAEASINDNVRGLASSSNG